ncbi:hypothetical protein N7456_012445 [Penicillium angulare]|uniref:G domain-containing protein n=1 Tax=Penicillium angulare TaxID=116970 RepID=A0A9W9K0Q0_9EURO|nr:hypothetical protein N7456_012445 [Penicillium angulare]
MSPCSRGAISRALRLGSLRYNVQPTFRQLIPSIHLSTTATLPQTSFKPRLAIPRNSRQAFSTTPPQCRQISPAEFATALPICCPGCGAFTQTIEPEEPGYYGGGRRQTRKLLARRKNEADKEASEVAVKEALDTDEIPLETSSVEDGLSGEPIVPKPSQDGALPDDVITPPSPSSQSESRTSHVCDRCHDLIHHNKTFSAPKPSIVSIREYLDESPHREDRVYHVIDAVDFPMSLVPRIHEALAAQEQRSRNRRSHTEKYSHGKKLPTISFIITRSDLLAATKDQVDSKMEYVRSILREALGKTGKDARLGNVHMISAHRGWWTKQVKEEIREHGGGIWVVGKANVGKSSFIESCFPKDSRGLENMAEWIEKKAEQEIVNKHQTAVYDSDSILPPAPQEDTYPVLPIISSMPGTTVSPIRIPFGRGRGEMIDLPGMERSELENFVRDEHKRDLIMTKRVKPDRNTIKPGQSLILGGGLVRISAVNPEDTIMAVSFLPIESHITNTAKAIDIQAERKTYVGKVLMTEGTGSSISSAGKIDLKWDTTKSNLPTSIAKTVKDKGVPIPHLPYRVMAADILIEGCGWLEVSIQRRNKRNSEEDTIEYPQVEVFTPNGEFIGSRRPIECWTFTAEKLKADKRKRPRLRFRYQ